MFLNAENETATLSLLDTRRRLEETRIAAVLANEGMFDALVNLDPDDCGIDERINREMKIAYYEFEAERAWKRYEKAVLRCGWEIKQAKKAGLL
jgi:hypothetical protein